MKNLLFSLTVLCLLIVAISCDGPKKEKLAEADLEQALEQNLADSTLVTGWYHVVSTQDGFKRQLDKTDEFYFINPKPIVIKKHFSNVAIYATDDFKEQQPENHFAISIQIDKEYEDLWADGTEQAAGKWIGLVIDNKLVSVPMVKWRIEGGRSSLNRGVYSKEELENFLTQF